MTRARRVPLVLVALVATPCIGGECKYQPSQPDGGNRPSKADKPPPPIPDADPPAPSSRALVAMVSDGASAFRLPEIRAAVSSMSPPTTEPDTMKTTTAPTIRRRVTTKGNGGAAANEAGSPSANSANLKRLREQIEMASAAGLALPPPVYALGTEVNDTGRKNFARKRRAWAERPAFSSVCDQAIGRIVAEHREDVELNLGDVAMRADTGMICDPSTGGQWKVTRTGLGGLLTGLGITAGNDYLLKCPPSLRAINVNHWTKGVGDAGGKSWVLRTREAVTRCADCQPGEDGATPKVEPHNCGRCLGTGSYLDGREIFAGVSTKYPTLDADKLAAVARSVVPEGAHGELLYDGERFRLGASWFSDIRPDEVCAGEMFRAWMFISTRDDGKGAISVRWGVERNLCLNLIILGQSEVRLSVSHRGTVEELRAAVEQAMGQASAAIGPFAEKWSEGRRYNLMAEIASAGKWGAADLFRGLVVNDLVRVPGVDTDEMVRRLVAAWQKEPGYSVADVVNAVTRAAHESPWSSPWSTDTLETQAGELLYNRVYWSDVVEAGQSAA